MSYLVRAEYFGKERKVNSCLSVGAGDQEK